MCGSRQNAGATMQHQKINQNKQQPIRNQKCLLLRAKLTGSALVVIVLLKAQPFKHINIHKHTMHHYVSFCIYMLSLVLSLCITLRFVSTFFCQRVFVCLYEKCTRHISLDQGTLDAVMKSVLDSSWNFNLLKPYSIILFYL